MIRAALLVILFALPMGASNQEDVAADSVANAFLQVRQAAHLSKLERMGRNTFREKVCKNDMRFSSGLIIDVTYATSNPAELPESAQKLATRLDSGKTAARFGVGVCIRNGGSPGHPQYSVLIATYESRRESFLRFFWD